MKAVQWFGSLPAKWEAKRADAVLDYCKTPARMNDFAGGQVFHYSIPAIQETGDGAVEDGAEIESDKISLSGGELLVSKLNPRKGCVLLAKQQSLPIVCSTEFVPLVARPTFDARFAFYVYSSVLVRELISATVQSVTRSHQRANPEDISKIWLPIPPLAEQRAIADFLDRETERLDALVAQKERLLELLAEKRRALVTRAVTRGLNPAAPLRDSGLPWLGQIPAAWKLNRLKFIAQISYGVGDELDKSLTSGVPLISLPNVDIEGSLHLEELGWANLSESEKASLLLRKGDLLFNWRNGSSAHVGKTAYFDAEGEFTHVGFLLRIRFDLSRYEPRFFQAFLQTLRATGYFLYTRAMVNNTFNQTELGNLYVVVPSLDEQRTIVAHIAAETAKLDALRAAAERTMGLLKERRAALIAAAVTGRIDAISKVNTMTP